MTETHELGKAWELEHLIKKAFARTKERFLSYFLAVVLSIGINIAVLLGVALIGGLGFLLLNSLTKSGFIIGTVGTIMALAAVISLMYVSAWNSLSITNTIIGREKKGVIQSFKDMRPLVWAYVGFSLLSGLFFLGLMPFSVLSFMVIFVLWSLWSSFSTFVFLTTHHRGLNVLWASKAIISQKFWTVVGRGLLVFGAIWFVSTLLIGNGDNTAGAFASLLFSMLTAPFAMSFWFEMFSLLKHPTTVRQPTIWMILAIIGYILMALFFNMFYSSIMQVAPMVLKERTAKIYQQKMMQESGMYDLKKITTPR